MGRKSAVSISVMAIMAGALVVWGQSVPKPHLTLEQPAPELAVTDLNGKATSLATLRTANSDKVLVLQFGSLTDPIFRLHNDAVERSAGKNAAKAAFILIYQQEAHPADGADALEVNKNDGFNIAQPVTMAERVKLAGQAVERLHISHQTVVVDAWNNASSQRYGSYSNMTFVVDAKGKLQAGYPFMDMAKVQAAIDLLAAGQPLPVELKGATQQEPAAFDAAAAAMDMTGGRGPAGIAAVLDRITLGDAQKRAVLAGIAEYIADVQEFRQARGSLPGAAAARGAATTPARAGGAAGAPARGPTTPADVQGTLVTLRASAEKLKGIIKGNVPAKDVGALYDALDQMAPAQRLFGNP